MAKAGTHGLLVASPGGTAAANTSLGTITLPAGGPFVIHGVYGQCVRQTANAGESVGGTLSLVAGSGDVTPNILPNAFPVVETGSFLGAIADQTVCPLNIFTTNLQAAGKAIIELFYQNEKTTTAAPLLIAGILFGDAAPEVRPVVHVGRARAAISTNVLQAVGTITVPQDATRITGIMGVLLPSNIITAGEETIGYWQMTSDDEDLTPAIYPYANVYGTGLGATMQSVNNLRHQFIPVNIPTIGGARLNIQTKLTTAVTNACEANVYIAFE